MKNNFLEIAPPPKINRADYLGGLQWLRGMAALMVLGFHTTEQLFVQGITTRHPWKFGANGVDLFFVISGFIITYAHRHDIGKPALLGTYLLKRLGRIYPLYWTVFLPFLAILFIASHFGFDDKFGAAEILKSFFLIPQDKLPILGVAWTLSFELFFYFIFSIAILNRTYGIAVGAVFATAIILANICPIYSNLNYIFQFFLSPLNLEFGLGVLVAMFFTRTQGNMARSMIFFTVIPAAILIFLGAHFNSPLLYRSGTLGGISALLAYFFCSVGQRVNPKTNFYVQLATSIGAATYSIYLVHYPFLIIWCKLSHKLHLNPYICGIPAFFAAVGFGVLTYRFIEAPQQRRISSWIKSLQGKSPKI